VKNPIKAAKSFIIEPLNFYANMVLSMFALRIEDIEDINSVSVNNYYKKLYCIEIAGAGENLGYLSESLINTLKSDFIEDENGRFTWVLLKDGLLKKNLIFTQNERMAKIISKNTISKMLTFDEILNTILSLYFNNEYKIDWIERTLKQKIIVDVEQEFKNPINFANNLIRERVFANYEKIKFYQAIEYINKDKNNFDIDSFFTLDFKGAFFTKVILDRKAIAKEIEEQKLNTALQLKGRDKNWLKQLAKTAKDDDFIMLNTILEIYEDEANVYSNIEKIAKCKFDLVKTYQKKYVNSTPLLVHNADFSRIVKKSFLYNYIGYNSKLNSDQPHLCGINKYNTFVNFGFKKATIRNTIPKQHAILLGTSGAGKTQKANEILKMLLGYDYKNKTIAHIDETNHIIFDIKDSFYNLIKSIKKDFPNLVDMNDFNKNDFKYNIVDCDIIKRHGYIEVVESDLDFAATLISLVLASSGDTSNILRTSESEEFKRAIREIYTKNNFESMPLTHIRNEYMEEYKKLRSLGYEEFTTFSEIKEKGYEKFKKPLLLNIINLLKQWKIRYKTKNETLREEILSSLIIKLETINSMGIFSNYSKLNFKKKKIIYFRTDNIVGGNDYGYLVFAMQSILAKMVKKSQHQKRVKKQKRPLYFFWYEEARNIFSNELFKKKEVFERIINEWRSYDMVFFPITQEPQHIPDSILNGFEIKMILTAGDDEDERVSLINSLSERLAIGEKRKKMLDTLPKYTMLVMYGDGAFTMSFEDDEDFRNLVDT